MNGAQKATLEEIRHLLYEAKSINSTKKVVDAVELLMGMVEDVIAAHENLAAYVASQEKK